MKLYYFFLLITFSFQYSHAQTNYKTEKEIISHIPGRVIIKFGNDPGLSKTNGKTGIKSVDKILLKAGDFKVNYAFPFLRNSRKAEKKMLENICIVHFSPDYDIEMMIDELNNDPSVVYAEPMRIFQMQDIPNDPQFPSMEWFDRVNAAAAWDEVKGEQGDVVIAVVDGGIDLAHEDLQANIWINEDEIPGNGIDDDNNGFIDDVNGWNFDTDNNNPSLIDGNHGTHVAGIAAAVTNNGKGISSLSWNCRVMTLKMAVLGKSRGVGMGFTSIVYAVNNGADIISCSWGNHSTPSQYEQEVIDFALANGVLIVAAAGNYNNDIDSKEFYPASYRGVLSVGASGSSNDSKPEFSNYGKNVDVFTPGVDILSSIPNDQYDIISGTSMATPLTAALAALVKTQHPDWGPLQVREQIRITCDNIENANPGFEGKMGSGRINAFRAVTENDSPGLQISGVSWQEIEGNGDNIIDAGETIGLNITFTNYLEDGANINIELQSEDPAINIIENQQSINVLNHGDSTELNFVFSTDNSLEDGHVLRFYTGISADNDYEDTDRLRLVITPPQYVTHNTGKLRVSVIDNGNIGAAGFIGASCGAGFIFDGHQFLYESGFLAGTGPDRVSDALRVIFQERKHDFKLAEGQSISIGDTSGIFDRVSHVIFDDRMAENPLNIRVDLQGYTINQPDSAGFIVLEYEIKNENAAPLENIYFGFYLDIDINANAEDLLNHNAAERMVVTQNSINNPDKIAALKLLSEVPGYHHHTFSIAPGVSDFIEFTDAQKFQSMSGGIQEGPSLQNDVSSMTGAGPFTLQPGQSETFAIALFGAGNMAELENTADMVQNLWDIFVGIGENEKLQEEVRFSLFPNPVTDKLNINWESQRTAGISFEVINLNGQVLASKNLPNAIPGRHSLQWQTEDLPAGSYILRMLVDGKPVVAKLFTKY